MPERRTGNGISVLPTHYFIVREQLAIGCSSITIHDLHHTSLCGSCYACNAIASLDALVAERDRAAAALKQALDCKGEWNGTVSEKGGYPAICPMCANAARSALAEVDRA